MIRKLRIISAFMSSSSGKEIVTICILPIITRSKGNQTIKFGQLIEYEVRNIFLKVTNIFLKIIMQKMKQGE